MKKLGYVLVFLFTMAFSTVSYAQFISPSGVSCDSCESCQEAVDNYSYVKLADDITSSLSTCVEITKPGTVFDCDGNSITALPGLGGHNAIILDNTNEVTVKNCTVVDWKSIGIWIINTDHSIVRDNTIQGADNSDYGIQLWGSDAKRNRVSNNTISDVEWGIYLRSGPSYNNITANDIYGVFDGAGIRCMNGTRYNNITGNTIEDFDTGIRIEGNGDRFYSNTITSCVNDGIYFDYTAVNNYLWGNEVTGNLGHDIDGWYVESGDGNWGDDNTCNTYLNWRDFGMKGYGCTYSN